MWIVADVGPWAVKVFHGLLVHRVAAVLGELPLAGPASCEHSPPVSLGPHREELEPPNRSSTVSHRRLMVALHLSVCPAVAA
jgi:hypothetical protein